LEKLSFLPNGTAETCSTGTVEQDYIGGTGVREGWVYMAGQQEGHQILILNVGGKEQTNDGSN
jgi:hypothetical protein